jgi:hypothetical protein
MIELRLLGIQSDRVRLEHAADVFIGVTGRFELVADEKLLYAEDDFPVVELAAELHDWLRTGFAARVDFEFDSMSTPEPGWVWIRDAGAGWRLGSLHQTRADAVVRSDHEVRRAVERFINSVKASAASALGADVSPYLEGAPP